MTCLRRKCASCWPKDAPPVVRARVLRSFSAASFQSIQLLRRRSDMHGSSWRPILDKPAVESLRSFRDGRLLLVAPATFRLQRDYRRVGVAEPIEQVRGLRAVCTKPFIPAALRHSSGNKSERARMSCGRTTLVQRCQKTGCSSHVHQARHRRQPRNPAAPADRQILCLLKGISGWKTRLKGGGWFWDSTVTSVSSGFTELLLCAWLRSPKERTGGTDWRP